MIVVHHACLPCERCNGEFSLGAAMAPHGVSRFEVWLRTLVPGARTDTLTHGGELVVLALESGGKLLVDGGPQRFQAPCTLLIPPGTTFQIVNDGLTPLPLIWVFTDAPVPWRAAPNAPPPDPEGSAS